MSFNKASARKELKYTVNRMNSLPLSNNVQTAGRLRIYLHTVRLGSRIYVVWSKSFRPDIQKPCQMENAVKDI